MADTRTRELARGSGPIHDTGQDHVESGEMHHKGRLLAFRRHFLEMIGAMVVGIIVTSVIFVFVVGLKSWDEVTAQYPTQALLAMAVGMTLPMIAWMRFRGMAWRSSYEMAAAMVLPVIPFLCLVWFGVTKSAQCGAYCLVMVVAMCALMRYRRTEYAHH
jgi:hypothetical protein